MTGFFSTGVFSTLGRTGAVGVDTVAVVVEVAVVIVVVVVVVVVLLWCSVAFQEEQEA